MYDKKAYENALQDIISNGIKMASGEVKAYSKSKRKDKECR
ncbi:MAG: hypothetical protein RR602_11110 [Longicatena sp.]